MNGQRITTWSHNRAHIDSGEQTVPNGVWSLPRPIALCGALGLTDLEIERRGLTTESFDGLPMCKRCQAKHDKEVQA